MAGATSGFHIGQAPVLRHGGLGITVGPSPIKHVQTPRRSGQIAWYGGTYKIDGVTVKLGVPVQRTVYLMKQTAPFVMREYKTLANGIYNFPGLAQGKYIVIGIDQTQTDQGVIYSIVDAVQGPYLTTLSASVRFGLLTITR
jgi:hypothetical protein